MHIYIGIFCRLNNKYKVQLCLIFTGPKHRTNQCFAQSCLFCCSFAFLVKGGRLYNNSELNLKMLYIIERIMTNNERMYLPICPKFLSQTKKPSQRSPVIIMITVTTKSEPLLLSFQLGFCII